MDPVECPEAPRGSPDGTWHGRKHSDSISRSGWTVRGDDARLTSFPGGPSLLPPPSPLQTQGLPENPRASGALLGKASLSASYLPSPWDQDDLTEGVSPPPQPSCPQSTFPSRSHFLFSVTHWYPPLPSVDENPRALGTLPLSRPHSGAEFWWFSAQTQS